MVLFTQSTDLRSYTSDKVFRDSIVKQTMVVDQKKSSHSLLDFSR